MIDNPRMEEKDGVLVQELAEEIRTVIDRWQDNVTPGQAVMALIDVAVFCIGVINCSPEEREDAICQTKRYLNGRVNDALRMLEYAQKHPEEFAKPN
jgi:hypothetical protein